MKLVVTGATGLLGREAALSAIRRGHQVIAIGRSKEPVIPGVTRALRMNLEDFTQLSSLMLEEFPEAVVNCAALATVDGCEREPDLARVLNAELPVRLAELAFHVGAKLVHVSTDMVFDGVSGRYGHTSTPSPLSCYGRTKAAGEVGALRAGREHAAVIRTTLINGNSVEGGKGLHERMFRSWMKGEPLTLFTDEVRQPVGLSNLADALVELCERPGLSGVYHWAGADALSRHEIGLRICRHMGLDPRLVVAAESASFASAVPRPRDLSLSLVPLAGKLKTPVQTFEEQMSELRVPRGCETWYEAQTGRKVVRRLEKGIDF